MSRRRWIADEWSGERAAITGANARHLAQVLRAKPGQQFEIAWDGAVRLGTIASVSDARVEFELGEPVSFAEIGREITLVLAVFKFDRLEWAIEKVTELGVTRIIPVIAQRTDAHLAKAAEKRAERWRRIAHEASQQSRRSAEPEIADPILIKKLDVTGIRIVMSESEKNIPLHEVVVDGPLTLAIGPEGGWSPAEEEWFRQNGWQAASLGATILRAETAAIAALAIVQAKPQTP